MNYKKIFCLIFLLATTITLGGCSKSSSSKSFTSPSNSLNSVGASEIAPSSNCIPDSELERSKQVVVKEPAKISGIYCRVKSEIELPTNIYVSTNSGSSKDGKFIAEIGKTTDNKPFYKTICHTGSPDYTTSMANMILLKVDNKAFTGPKDGDTSFSGSGNYQKYLEGEVGVSNVFDIYVKDCAIPAKLQCPAETTYLLRPDIALAATDTPPETIEYGLAAKKMYTRVSQFTKGSGELIKQEVSNPSTFGEYNVYKKIVPIIDQSIAKINSDETKSGRIQTEYIYLVKRDQSIDNASSFTGWLYGSNRYSEDKENIGDDNGLFISAWEPPRTPDALGGWFKVWIPESKPAIYLYPEKQSQISVKVTPRQGFMTVSDPDYNGGWNVTASPDGFIYSNNRTYRHLFYEAMLPTPDMSEKFDVIDGKRIREELFALGKKLSLTDRESREMADYWANKLPQKNYYQVGLITGSEVDQIEPMKVNPVPDSIFRLRLIFKGLDEKQDTLNPLQAMNFERKGFAVVEWGGFVLK